LTSESTFALIDLDRANSVLARFRKPLVSVWTGEHAGQSSLFRSSSTWIRKDLIGRDSEIGVAGFR
jgi:hypothetical protein